MDNTQHIIKAYKKGDLGQVKYFVKKGANIEAKNYYGETPLFLACKNGHIESKKNMLNS